MNKGIHVLVNVIDPEYLLIEHMMFSLPSRAKHIFQDHLMRNPVKLLVRKFGMSFNTLLSMLKLCAIAPFWICQFTTPFHALGRVSFHIGHFVSWKTCANIWTFRFGNFGQSGSIFPIFT